MSIPVLLAAASSTDRASSSSSPDRGYPLLVRGYEIYCGFDTDEPGETASRQMIARHPSIERLRPSGHD